ncbi:MAG: DUF3604 domain-containing protein [Gammaproteobacteria bacterium]
MKKHPSYTLLNLKCVGFLAGFALLLVGMPGMSTAEEPAFKDKQVLFGDLHVHTALSFDSYIFGNRNMPEDAYLYAKGLPIQHPGGFTMQLDRPLDFLGISDHAVYLGMLPAMDDPHSVVADHPFAVQLRGASSIPDRLDAFREMGPRFLGDEHDDDLLNPEVVGSTWDILLDAADRHNDPGNFTALIGYEFTASREFGNLHRNVFFDGSGQEVPAIPFSRIDGDNNPEQLWQWMDRLRTERQLDSIAIPHNSNGSDGRMFRLMQTDGSPFDAEYVATRMRNEPLVEVSQVKGTSETHPELSPEDEWADFEIMGVRIGTYLPSKIKGSYIREAYRNGLELSQLGIGNPYQFGLVAASDTHVAAGAFHENDFWSKIGLVDATAELRGSVPLSWKLRLAFWYLDMSTALSIWWEGGDTMEQSMTASLPPEYMRVAGYRAFPTIEWGASGLTGVWAEENTRESIFAAMRSREVFGTSGPRMVVRFFAGYDYSKEMLSRPGLKQQLYDLGQPMGTSIQSRNGQTPGFIVWGVKDPEGASLERVQVIKGWIDAEGNTHEKVFDVACSQGVQVNPRTHRCQDIVAEAVYLETCEIDRNAGSAEFREYWQDPEFDAGQEAFYYVRLLEQPSCRWSTWDAVKAGEDANPLLKKTLQERAWSSPVWYQP